MTIIQVTRSVLKGAFFLISSLSIGQTYEIKLQYAGQYKILNSIKDSVDLFKYDTIQISVNPIDLQWDRKLEKEDNRMLWEEIKFDVRSDGDSIFEVWYNLKLDSLPVRDISGHDSSMINVIEGQNFSGKYTVVKNVLTLYHNKRKYTYILQSIGNTLYLRRQPHQ